MRPYLMAAVITRDAVAELASVGLPTVIVSHDFAEVVGLAGRIATAATGRVLCARGVSAPAAVAHPARPGSIALRSPDPLRRDRWMSR